MQFAYLGLLRDGRAIRYRWDDAGDGAHSTACSAFVFLSNVMPANNPFELATSTNSNRPSEGISTIPTSAVQMNAWSRCPLVLLSPMIAPVSVTKSPLLFLPPRVPRSITPPSSVHAIACSSPLGVLL